MQLQNITVFYLKILYWISQVKIVLNFHMNKFGLQTKHHQSVCEKENCYF